MTGLRRAFAAAAVAVALVGATATGASAAPTTGSTHPELRSLRAATASFHSLAAAQHKGYGLLKDLQGISCIAMPGMGAMGVHYVRGDLVGDPAIDPLHPEALVYAPASDGTLHLAAVEYVVIKAAWDATHDAPPSLFGHTFNTTDAPNRYGLPTFYSLHVWAWQDNPAGTFEMWNPDVHCSCM